jgi:hypothetical protein
MFLQGFGARWHHNISLVLCRRSEEECPKPEGQVAPSVL